MQLPVNLPLGLGLQLGLLLLLGLLVGLLLGLLFCLDANNSTPLTPAPRITSSKTSIKICMLCLSYLT
jgi:hypothetical protein